MTVFILGAGASKGAGYPLGNELGSCLKAWLQNGYRNSEEDDAVYHLLDRLERSRSNNDFSGAKLTFEDALKHALLADPKLAKAIRDCLVGYFRHIRSGPESLTYRKFACSHVYPGDVVVSFNYDLEIEAALKGEAKWDEANGYGMALAEGTPSPVTVLKLHGSVNWYLRNLNVLRNGKRVQKFALFRDGVVVERSYLGSSSGDVPLILPIADKRYCCSSACGDCVECQLWPYLFEQAKRALAEADKIVVIGYSFPKVDKLSRNLLGTANRTASIEIHCRGASQQVADLIREALHCNVYQCKNSGFEEFVILGSMKK